MTIFKIRHKNYDTIVHCSVQSSPDLGGNWFPCGQLAVPTSDFKDLRKSMPGIEFEEIN